MIVSLAWLRELCPVPADPDEVSARLTARGLTVDAVERHGDDVRFDIDVPANRPDCLGHLGIARELAAAFGAPLAPRPASPPGIGGDVSEEVRVLIDAPDRCSRYTARLVRGVRVGPSPEWVVRRLETCGLRSVNNVVDASNLVLLELGQPIHTFDLSRIEGGTIVVRAALPGEVLRTLDGEDRVLDEEVLVIADAGRAVALAGVIGGAESEIRERTTDVLIESAWFDPRSIRPTARRYGIVTDASQRFGRGADPEAPPVSQDLAARLLVELAGGAVAPGMIDVHPRPLPDRTAALRLERAASILGWDAGADSVRQALAALGLKPKPEGEGRLRVTVPSWRVDLDREEDLIEEVARHLGYDNVPTRLPAGGTGPRRTGDADPEESCRDLLAAFGFHEAFAYAMIGAEDDEPFVPAGSKPSFALTNPIADWISHLRRSILPGLVRSADRNFRRGNLDVRLFELGHVFLPRDGRQFPDEPRRLGLAWSGAARPRHWSSADREVDFHDVAGIVRAVASRLGAETELDPVAVDVEGFHPGRSAAWLGRAGDTVARAGALHPALRDRFDLQTTLWLVEIDLDLLLASPSARPRVVPPPRVPAVSRDLSFVVPRAVAFGTLLEAVRGVRAPAPARFELIDRYEGPAVGEDAVSLTIRVFLQPPETTLTDDETERFKTELVSVLTDRFDAKLRT